MIYIVIVLCVLLFAGVIENLLHQRMLQKIPLRILVNGTRGKTTVTRMAASVLNAAGIRTYAKTTGSQARWIFPDGHESAYRRGSRPANIMEQLPFVRLAVNGGAQAIVTECMAQRIDNQFLFADKLIRPHYVLMTNAYVDHIEEIGETEEETVRVLAQSIAKDSILITRDMRFAAYTDSILEANDKVDLSRLADCPFAVHEENVQLVSALAAALGIPREIMYDGIRKTKPDIGMVRQIHVGTLCVRNAFAANDPTSFQQALSECAEQGDFALLYNHRKDRAYRLEGFSRVLKNSSAKPLRIGVIGENRYWSARYLQRQTGLPCEAVAHPVEWTQAVQDVSLVLCCGNIKGEGGSLLEQLMGEEHKNV